MTFVEQRDTTRAQLTAAQERLAELQKELPTFENLVTENETLEAEIRKRKASLDELSAQKLRTISARELLEQHENDIATLEAEVKEQTDELDRLEQLVTLKDLETELAKLQKECENDETKLIADIQKRFESLKVKRTEWHRLTNHAVSASERFTGASWTIPSGNSDTVQQMRKDLQEARDLLRENGLDTSVLTHRPHARRLLLEKGTHFRISPLPQHVDVLAELP
jgi:chromosome segregation ATPase